MIILQCHKIEEPKILILTQEGFVMARWKEALKIEVNERSPMPPEKLEGLKQLIKKVAMRKLKEMEETALREAA